MKHSGLLYYSYISEEYNLTQNSGIIYPLQDMQLSCALLTSALGSIQWRVDGADPSLNPKKYNILNNNHTLIVISVSAVDSGKYSIVHRSYLSYLYLY